MTGLIVTVALVAARTSQAHPLRHHAASSPARAWPVLHHLNHYRGRANRIQQRKCRPTWAWGTRPARLIPHDRRGRVMGMWKERTRLARGRSSRCSELGPVAAIRHVFGVYASQALAVAWCESRFSIWATNGQYLGLFQMGDYARSTYGHSSTALGQARAAHRYFVDSGRDWSPWACKP